MLTTFPLKSGASVTIVPVALAHADMLAALIAGDIAHLGAFLPALATLATSDAARSHLEVATAAASAGERFEWHVFLDGVLCGTVRLKNIDAGRRKAEIGYYLGSRFSGQGIATLAVRAVLGHAFASMNLNRIELRCAATNTPSMGVARRLGFTLEGVMRQDEWLGGAFVDLHVYGLLRSEFAG